MGFGRVPTPAKYVLLVHMNMLQGLKIHQGLKIRHMYTQTFPVFTSQRWTTIEMTGRSADHTEVAYSNIGTRPNDVFFQKWLVSKIAWNFKTHVRFFFKNEPVGFETFSMYRDRTRSRNSRTSNRSNYSVYHWCSILFFSTYKSALYLFHVSSGDFTAVEMNAIEQHWKNCVHKALPATGIHENLKVCFPNFSVQVEFNWYQTSVCWNSSILHYRGRNHPK